MELLFTIVEVAKVIIAFFITSYAYFFLRKSEHYTESKPWEYLFIASLFLFCGQILSMLRQLRAETFDHNLVVNARLFLELLFYGFLLFAFIYQHNLIRKRHIIVISDRPVVTFYDRIASLFHKQDVKPDNAPVSVDEELAEVETELEKEEPIPETEQPLQKREQVLIDRSQELIRRIEWLLEKNAKQIAPDRRKLVKTRIGMLQEALEARPVDEKRITTLIKELTGHEVKL